jgi:hypothetical protein
MKSRSLVCLLTMFILHGCSGPFSADEEIPAPLVSGLMPSTQTVGEEKEVTVTGSHFIVQVMRQLSGDAEFKVNDHFELRLDMMNGIEGVYLRNVRHLDDETLKAIVPAATKEGVYNATVTTPYGYSHTKLNAYTVRAKSESSQVDTGSDKETGTESDSDSHQSIDSDTASAASTDSGTDPPATDGLPTDVKRLSLTFQNEGQAEDLVNFPVLVTLNSDRIDYADIQSSGEDIRFFDSDGAILLAHEIEQWNETGASFIWVRVPEIAGRSSTDMIWMYYGASQPGPSRSPNEVWSEHYEAVYHLTTLNEATGNLQPAFSFDASDAVAGIGHSRLFTGFNSYVSLGLELPLVQNVTQCTLSAWIRPETYTISETPYIIGISVGTTGGAPTIYSRAALYLSNANRISVVGRSVSTDDLQILESNADVINAGTWHHVVGVIDYSARQMQVYVNGINQGSGTVWFNQPATFNIASHSAVLGTQEDYSADFYTGIIDEVRIADTARSADWIAAQHLSLSDAFIVYGEPEAISK